MNALTQRTSLPLAQEPAQFDYILLDGSGSMSGQSWWDALAAIDSYVAQLKVSQCSTHIRLHIFTDGAYIDMLGRDEEIDDWTPLMQDPIGSMWGSTPLFDAIEIMGARLRELNPTRCAITIVTDGDENGSTSCDETRARAILDWMRSKGWSVTFIGYDFNNSSLAKALGVSGSAAIGVQKALLQDATKELARKRAAYGKTGAPVHWSEGEQKQFGGYLSHQS
jgi:hypothetical protein